MALHELHARRLATVANIVESALDRIELVFRQLQTASEAASPALTNEQIQQARESMEDVRRRLRAGLGRFSVRPHKPEPKQVLAAELSTLWVVLENAMPRRMKGYGRELQPRDRADWENLIQGLLHDIKHIRRISLARNSKKPSVL